MHVKLLFWMSVMLLLVGDIVALNCTQCDADYMPGNCDPTKVPPESVDCEIDEAEDPHCITLALGTEVKWKNCANLFFIKKFGIEGNECTQIEGHQYKAASKGPNTASRRRTLKEGGPEGRFGFEAEPFKKYEFCSCKGDDCNIGASWPFGAPVTSTTSTTTTTKKTGGGGGGGGSGSGSGGMHSSLGLVRSFVIMSVLMAQRINGF